MTPTSLDAPPAVGASLTELEGVGMVDELLGQMEICVERIVALCKTVGGNIDETWV